MWALCSGWRQRGDTADPVRALEMPGRGHEGGNRLGPWDWRLCWVLWGTSEQSGPGLHSRGTGRKIPSYRALPWVRGQCKGKIGLSSGNCCLHLPAEVSLLTQHVGFIIVTGASGSSLTPHPLCLPPCLQSSCQPCWTPCLQPPEVLASAVQVSNCLADAARSWPSAP